MNRRQARAAARLVKGSPAERKAIARALRDLRSAEPTPAAIPAPEPAVLPTGKEGLGRTPAGLLVVQNRLRP
jgi:hypothetical protein